MSILQRFRDFLRPYDMNERMLSPYQAWGRGMTWRPLNGAGISVTAEMAMQAATGACIRLLADDISSLPVDVFRKEGGASVPSNRPTWLEYPTGRRWDTFQAHLSDVVVSLLSDGNVFNECFPDAFSPSLFRIHDPESVEMFERGSDLIFRMGARELSEGQMMHIPWVRMPGKLRGISVLESAQSTASLEIAAREWAGAFFRNGGTLGTIIKHPGKPSPDEVDLMRESFNDRHQGSANAWKMGILTGGADIASGSIKPDEGALEPLWKHVLEEAARLYHIPPHLLGSQQSGAVSYASVEHRSIEYVQHAVIPVVTRIEAAYSRLLGRNRYIKLNVNALLRGDAKSRAEYYQIMTGMKAMKPSYVATLEDFPPEQAIDGWLETPNNNGPKQAAAEPADRAIHIDSLHVADEAVDRMTERVTGVIVEAREEHTADLAQSATDVLSLAQREAEERRAEADRLIEAQRQAEAERAERERLPIEKRVMRDEAGRIVGVISTQGDTRKRTIVDRDAIGNVVGVREVFA